MQTTSRVIRSEVHICSVEFVVFGWCGLNSKYSVSLSRFGFTNHDWYAVTEGIIDRSRWTSEIWVRRLEHTSRLSWLWLSGSGLSVYTVWTSLSDTGGIDTSEQFWTLWLLTDWCWSWCSKRDYLSFGFPLRCLILQMLPECSYI